MNKFSLHEGGGGVPLKLWDSHQPFEAGASKSAPINASIPILLQHFTPYYVLSRTP